MIWIFRINLALHFATGNFGLVLDFAFISKRRDPLERGITHAFERVFLVKIVS